MASVAPSPEGFVAHDERRTHPRAFVALPAFVHVGEERYPVQLLDLSPGGAKLKGAKVFSAGTKVKLDCGTLGRSAVVRWQNGDQMGICFDAELNEREVGVQVQRSKALAAWLKARECAIEKPAA